MNSSVLPTGFVSASSSSSYATASVTGSSSSTLCGFAAFANKQASDLFKQVASAPISKPEKERDSENEEDDSKPFEEAPTLDAAGDATQNAILAEQVKDAKHEVSGEENDTVLHKVRCKLFTITKREDGKLEPVDTGTGELHVNTTKVEDGSTKHRLLLRQEKTNKLLLNSLLHDKVKASLDGNCIRFATLGYNLQVLSYIFRVHHVVVSMFSDSNWC